MKQVLVVGALVGALALPAAAFAQAGQKPQTSTAGRSQAATNPPAAGSTLGTVTLRSKAMANGQALTPGTYQVRLTADEPKPGVGQTPNAERYVEFLRGGKVVAREVATVIPQAEIGQVAEGPRPPAGGSRVDTLKGNDYVRVWINRGGMNYLIHLPTS